MKLSRMDVVSILAVLPLRNNQLDRLDMAEASFEAKRRRPPSQNEQLEYLENGFAKSQQIYTEIQTNLLYDPHQI